MGENKTNTYQAETISEVLYHLKNVQNIQVYAGCTLCTKNMYGNTIELPQSCVFIGNIDELKEINKTERYIDFGSCVTINQILRLGNTRIPPFLHEAASTIASHNIGNIATIGGNICHISRKMSLYAPLLALDALLEIRSTSEIRNIPLTKFSEMPKGFFLTKIRVPIEDWTTTTYIKIGSPYEQNENSASYTFLVDASKGSNLSDLRISFAGEHAFRSRELENTLIGARLPLTDRDCTAALEKASQLYDEELVKANRSQSTFLKSQFINLLELSLEELKRVYF